MTPTGGARADRTDRPDGLDVDRDHDTVIGVAKPGLVEPMEDGLSLVDADTVVSAEGPRNARAGSVGSDAPRTAGPPTVPLPNEEPERHPISTIRIGTHEPILLDVPTYIGRRPSAPRITGGRLPRLVMVPSPAREVSATHVEIRQEGPTVVVTDLGSTNGTTVTHPRGAPVTLRQGESVVLVIGSVVDIGDGIRVIIAPGLADPSAERLQ